ncbi:MAG: DUF4339 domain-containing protein [Lentisphaerae bacterium]|nr:DUF4339 domain-containing protein [Lentisphaerota bacterium]
MKWYYAEGQTHIGPLEPEQFASLISSGTILPQTYVWREGMFGWQLLSSINKSEISFDVQTSPRKPVMSAAESVAAALAENPKEQPRSATSVLAAALAEDLEPQPKSAAAILAAALKDEPKTKPKSSAEILAAALADDGSGTITQPQQTDQHTQQNQAAPSQAQQFSMKPVKRNLQLRSKTESQFQNGLQGIASSVLEEKSNIPSGAVKIKHAKLRNLRTAKRLAMWSGMALLVIVVLLLVCKLVWPAGFLLR